MIIWWLNCNVYIACCHLSPVLGAAATSYWHSWYCQEAFIAGSCCQQRLGLFFHLLVLVTSCLLCARTVVWKIELSLLGPLAQSCWQHCLYYKITVTGGWSGGVTPQPRHWSVAVGSGRTAVEWGVEEWQLPMQRAHACRLNASHIQDASWGFQFSASSDAKALKYGRPRPMTILCQHLYRRLYNYVT